MDESRKPQMTSR